jgi:AMP nucleosidase
MDVTHRSRADAPTIADMPRAAKKKTAPMDRKTTTTTQTFTDADAALKHATALYDDGIRRLRKSLQAFISGRQFHSRVREVYPSVRVRTQTVARRYSIGGAVSPFQLSQSPRKAGWLSARNMTAGSLIIPSSGASVSSGIEFH